MFPKLWGWTELPSLQGPSETLAADAAESPRKVLGDSTSKLLRLGAPRNSGKQWVGDLI